ncbi:hypothetical protein G7084_00620 [Weissella coleopterorum]|uniref:Uncharacterized protein n=1 Tax=Weissella coleopterorum TaxID=2714949 RepID=A0A6G8AY74_9LACO|nr:DUF6020 family protein [Weissella coleopterorum]QIL49957.1 hypothetical protein G7084_00620 [Weissella coleopterorum]
MEKINKYVLSKLFIVILVALGTNLFYTRGINVEQLNDFSGTSIIPILAMVISILLPITNNIRLFMKQFLIGLVITGVFFYLGYHNVGPNYSVVEARYIWNGLGIIGSSLFFAQLINECKNIRMINWQTGLVLASAFGMGVLIDKPQVYMLAPIDYIFTLKLNLIDGLIWLIFMYLILVKIKPQPIKIIQKIVLVIFTILVTSVYVIGISIDVSGDLIFLQTHKKFYVIATILMLIVLYTLIERLLIFLSHNKSVDHDFKFSKLTYKKILIINFLLWIPYILSYFPGTVGFDGMNQLAEFFIIHAQDGTQYYPTNHQPWFTTLVMGGVVKFGKHIFGTFAAGIGTYSVLVIVFAMFTNLAIVKLVISKKNDLWGWATFIFITIFPIFPYWYMTFDKTGLFILIFAWFMISSVPMFEDDKLNTVQIIKIIFWGSLLVLFRNDMIYVVFMSSIIGFIFNKNTRKHLFWILLMISFIYLGWNKVLIKSMDLVPSPQAEMLSIPIQQVIRSYRETPEVFSKNEIKKVNTAMSALDLNLNQISKEYNYGLADNTKSQLTGSEWVWQYSLPKNDRKRQVTLQTQLKKENKHVNLLMSVWKNNLTQSPLSYFTATFSNVYHYMYIFGINHGNGYRLTWNGNVVNSKHFKSNLVHSYDYELINEKQSGLTSFATTMRKNMGELIHAPIIGFFMVAGSWGLIILFILLDSVFWWKKQNAFIVILVTLVFLVNFAGPVDGGLRYIFPLMLTMPIILSTLKRNNKKYI